MHCTFSLSSSDSSISPKNIVLGGYYGIFLSHPAIVLKINLFDGKHFKKDALSDATVHGRHYRISAQTFESYFFSLFSVIEMSF